MGNICFKNRKRNRIIYNFLNRNTGTDKENLLWSFREDCCVCMENPVQTVLLDCGHVNLCLKCTREIYASPNFGECPICRSPMKGFATFTPNIKEIKN